jgi:hypothetical protein
MSGQHRISELSSWLKPFDDPALLWLQFELENPVQNGKCAKENHKYLRKSVREARLR